MTNFDYLKQESKFDSFSDVAISAEKVLHIDIDLSVINCRRAMEFAIKWMYSVDKSLQMPYQDTLHSLMSTEDFHNLVDDALWKRLDLIRKIGNKTAHSRKKITMDEATLCLQNLFIFMDFVAYCYADSYVPYSPPPSTKRCCPTDTCISSTTRSASATASIKNAASSETEEGST